MRLSVRRYNPMASIRSLLSPKGPAVTLPVTNREVDCPRALDGMGKVERCMTCDRLIVLEADAEGNGTVTCRPGAGARDEHG
jgi:hypothetical protein